MADESPNIHPVTIAAAIGSGSAASGTGNATVTNVYEIHQSPIRDLTDDDVTVAHRRAAALPTDQVPAHTPLPTGSRIPFTAQGRYFVGRDQAMLAVANLLRDQVGAVINPVAITGLGGIGKTFLASEFAHRYGTYFVGGVFWISCADPDTVQNQVSACLDLERVPSAGTLSVPDRANLVLTQWASPIPRLLIFDNCESNAVLERWLPRSGACRVLLTCWRQHWDPALNVQTLLLDLLTRADSIALLRIHRPVLADEPSLDAIAAELGDLPLAVELAGCYLAGYPGISSSAYLDDLRSTDPLAHPSLQSGFHSPTGHERHVARTFWLSYRQLKTRSRTNVVALSILSTAAYFAPGEPVPVSWLLQPLGVSVTPSTSEEVVRYTVARDGLRRLTSLGLLAEDGDTVLLHLLLGAFVLRVGQSPAILAHVENVVFDLAADPLARRLKLQRSMLLPHLRAVANRALPRGDMRAASLAVVLGTYLTEMAAFHAARPYLEQALAIRERLLGATDPAVGNTLISLGNLERQLGALEQAEILQQRGSAILAAALGPDDDATLVALGSLASTLTALGELDKAHAMLTSILDIRVRELGIDHVESAYVLNDLGNVFSRKGHSHEASRLYQQALAGFESAGDAFHSETSMCLYNLGLLAGKAGHTADGARYYQRALAIQEDVMGVDHPQVAMTLNNLGKKHAELNDLAGARPLLERGSGIFARVFGLLHLDTIRSKANLGKVLHELGELTAARECYTEVLRAREAVFGTEAPQTLNALSRLAHVLRDMGERPAALHLYERVVSTSSRVHGEESPEALHSRGNVLCLLVEMKDLQKARTLGKEVLHVQERVFGFDHLDTTITLNNLGIALHLLGDCEASTELHERALAIRQRAFGDGHLDVAVSLQNLALVRMDTHGADASARLLERALIIRESTLGADHPDTQSNRDCLLQALEEAGEAEKARQFAQAWSQHPRDGVGVDVPAVAE